MPCILQIVADSYKGKLCHFIYFQVEMNELGLRIGGYPGLFQCFPICLDCQFAICQILDFLWQENGCQPPHLQLQALPMASRYNIARLALLYYIYIYIYKTLDPNIKENQSFMKYMDEHAMKKQSFQFHKKFIIYFVRKIFIISFQLLIHNKIIFI